MLEQFWRLLGAGVRIGILVRVVCFSSNYKTNNPNSLRYSNLVLLFFRWRGCRTGLVCRWCYQTYSSTQSHSSPLFIYYDLPWRYLITAGAFLVSCWRRSATTSPTTNSSTHSHISPFYFSRINLLELATVLRGRLRSLPSRHPSFSSFNFPSALTGAAMSWNYLGFDDASFCPSGFASPINDIQSYSYLSPVFPIASLTAYEFSVGFCATVSLNNRAVWLADACVSDATYVIHLTYASLVITILLRSSRLFFHP